MPRRVAGPVVVVQRPVMGGNARMPGGLRSNSTELKALDFPASNQLLNATAVITPLNLIRAGSSFFNRVGRKIEMQSLRIVLEVEPLRSITADDYVRFMIVYDRQTNGALPAIADIIQTTDQAGANTTTPLSGINLNNRDRFVILRDHRLQLPSLQVAAGVVSNLGPQDQATRNFIFDDYIKLKGLVTQYKQDSAPAVIGDIATGSLLFVTFGEQAAGSEGYRSLFEARLRYKDL